MTRRKPRDYYELYFMLRKGLIPTSMMAPLSRVKDVLVKSKIDFSQDLGPFLPRNQAAIVKELSKILLEEMARHGI
jgi:hypothetical protein